MTPGMSGFQVCDIVDPVIKFLLEDPSYRRDEFDVRPPSRQRQTLLTHLLKDTDGWWHSAPLTRIRALMRKKYEGLGQGIAYTDEECMRLWDEGGIALPDDAGDGNLKKSSKVASITRYTKKKNRAKTRLTEDERRVNLYWDFSDDQHTYSIYCVGCKT